MSGLLRANVLRHGNLIIYHYQIVLDSDFDRLFVHVKLVLKARCLTCEAFT